ncbi:MAG: 1-deoxy-D-xylulose-5-phosphate reductoisomerase [Planctomycetota bacterium]
MPPARIVILGSTGSIGTQTLDVVAHLNAMGDQPSFDVVGLAAGRDSETLARQSRDWSCPVACAARGEGPAELIQRVHSERPIDLVVAAIVGFAGLAPTLAAVELGIDVALANKETLVAAGELVVGTAGRTGAQLLPVDSEHSALWQCLTGLARTDHAATPPMQPTPEIARMILTASGGALRDWPADKIQAATPAEALAHPTWDMGPKVTVDSATLMNKGFEAIEARWLFGIPAERLGVLIHPTSTVHSIVETADGGMLAQLGTPDMRTAIQYALLRGRHTLTPSHERLDLAKLGTLEFRAPDLDRFPMLGYAFDALRTGGTAGAILNAANETAVAAFLGKDNADGSKLALGRVPELVADAVAAIEPKPATTVDAIIQADAAAREHVRTRL